MRRGSSRFFLLIPFLALLMSVSEGGIDDGIEPQDASGGETGEATTVEEKKAVSWLTPYIPPTPERPAPDIRRTGGTRWKGLARPDVTLLVPNHVGLTLHGQPTLYWELSAESPVRIEIAVIDLGEEGAVEPLLEVPAKGSVKPGIHAFRSADHGLELESGKTYQWSVAVVRDPDGSASGKIARAFIERIAADEHLRAALADADGPTRRRILARNGIWYDALTALSEEIAADPANRGLRDERASLLEQVGLVELAQRERDAAPRR